MVGERFRKKEFCGRINATGVGKALVALLCFVTPAPARDCGTHGVIFPIEELDPIAVIQAKLKALSESGELQQHTHAIKEKVKASILHPSPVKDITKATKPRIFYYDPTFVVNQDYTDHQGKAFTSKRMKISPLKKISLSSSMIFFDGDDPDQMTWVNEQRQSRPAKLILTSGFPISLAEEWGQAIYVDQGGVLTQKLGIRHVPARVTQDGLRLRIEEIPLHEETKSPYDDRPSGVLHTGSKK